MNVPVLPQTFDYTQTNSSFTAFSSCLSVQTQSLLCFSVSAGTTQNSFIDPTLSEALQLRKYQNTKRRKDVFSGAQKEPFQFLSTRAKVQQSKHLKIRKDQICQMLNKQEDDR